MADSLNKAGPEPTDLKLTLVSADKEQGAIRETFRTLKWEGSGGRLDSSMEGFQGTKRCSEVL